jgi:hypothetical protein
MLQYLCETKTISALASVLLIRVALANRRQSTVRSFVYDSITLLPLSTRGGGNSRHSTGGYDSNDGGRQSPANTGGERATATVPYFDLNKIHIAEDERSKEDTSFVKSIPHQMEAFATAILHSMFDVEMREMWIQEQLVSAALLV